MLAAVAEGNILFYTVNTASPSFVQLQHASETTEAPSTIRPKVESRMPETEVLVSSLPGLAIATAGASRTPRPDEYQSLGGQASGPVIQVGIVSAPSRPSVVWSSPLRHPILLGAAGVGMALMVITISLVYLGMTNHRLVSQASRALSAKKTEVTVVVPQSSASGTMRGSRWQIVPGGFGGFSSATNSESF